MIVNVLVLVVLLLGYSESKTDKNRAVPKRREFTNVVTLHRLSADNKILPFCTGIIIHRKRVLTAAHCVADSNGELNITGVYVLSEGRDIGDIVTQRVSLGAIHPRYNQSKVLYDIALLSINGSFPDNINPVKIAAEDQLLGRARLDCQAIAWDERDSTNSKEYFIIYDRTDEGRVVRGKYNCNGRCNQKKIPMMTVIVDNCKEAMSAYNYTVKTDGSQFCASTHNLENCERLSGAPVMCSGFLHGIFSYGNICNITTPDVITRVTYFKYWIKIAGRYLRKKVIPSTKLMRELSMPALEDLPEVVALFRFANGREFKPYCGGGIISNRLVLTAAHCLVDNAGNIDTDGIFIMSSYKEFRFNPVDEHSGVAIHPGFNWEKRLNDIALVKIYGEFHPDISPVILPYYDDVKWDVSRFITCKVFGWGFKDYRSIENYFKYNYTSDTSFSITMDKSDCSNQCVLQMALVRPLPLWKCRKNLKREEIEVETNGSQFCAFGGIYDTCRGESGDLVFCFGSAYGIISEGASCGYNHLPVINTRISYYKQWIIETKDKMEKGT